MKFQIRKNLKTTLFLVLRECGYQLLSQGEAGEGNFVRAIHGARYPRFHVYAKERADSWELNLHLDQRRPVYKGTRAHGGEYEGSVVEQEAERIRKIAGA